MTAVKFYFRGSIVGYEIKGHSSKSSEDLEGKLVCSAVSSAAFMAANTITEIIGDRLEADVEDGYMKVIIDNPSKASRDVIKGLELHITELSKQYKTRIKITTEV